MSENCLLPDLRLVRGDAEMQVGDANTEDSGSTPTSDSDDGAAASRTNSRAGHQQGTAAQVPWRPSHPRAREGTAMVSIAGGDLLVVVAGWVDAWPSMRNDVLSLDLNPVPWPAPPATSMQLAQMTERRSPAPLPSPTASALMQVSRGGAAAPAIFEPTPALLEAAAACSPALTGETPRHRLFWRCAVDRTPDQGRAPRPRYGHTATVVPLAPSAVATLRAAAASAASQSNPPAPSSPRRTPSNSRPAAAAAAATPPPIEAIVISGGMFSGGYTSETGQLYVLLPVATPFVRHAEQQIPHHRRRRARGEATAGDGDGDDEAGDWEPARKKVATSSAESVNNAFYAAAISRTKQASCTLVSRGLDYEWLPVLMPGGRAAGISPRGYHAAAYSLFNGRIYISGGIARGNSTCKCNVPQAACAPSCLISHKAAVVLDLVCFDEAAKLSNTHP